ncbi:MAG: hypothetical protein IJY47_00650 [Clostridia bacterium]|nr:hypothetical protein [Clostridia bacterium]
MTHLEIDSAIVTLTRQACEACKKRLDTIPKENGTERKAILLELGMYTLCGNAGLLFNASKREEIFNTRLKVIKRILVKYPKLNQAFLNLSSEEQMTFFAALQGEIFIRDQILCKYRSELTQAETAGDTKNVFELSIKIGAILKMFDVWNNWRAENQIYPHILEEMDHE